MEDDVAAVAGPRGALTLDGVSPRFASSAPDLESSFESKMSSLMAPPSAANLSAVSAAPSSLATTVFDGVKGKLMAMTLELEDGHGIEVEVPEGLHAGDEFEAFVGHIGAPDEISGAPNDNDHDAEQLHGEEEEKQQHDVPGPLPEGWEIAISRSHGDEYYVNTLTGESTFERPTAPASALDFAHDDHEGAEEQEHEHLADLETLEKPAREQRCQKAKAQVQEFCDA